MSHYFISNEAYNYVPYWSVVGRGLADHDQQRSNRHAATVKPEVPIAVVRS
jgi:hypothetical protein